LSIKQLQLIFLSTAIIRISQQQRCNFSKTFDRRKYNKGVKISKSV